ncbi:CvpA family protein [Candidatus Caldatribacterium sp.]|uniref:CvpA family protein n=1 Tax=Candidatus Caldatribacterium sp. TaxID=2282143 RepID=UPI002996BAC8|nr:CvpA family protein [Candidatus Caldatribacterium sp.]MDW8080491.1 CvpA family protein [Candidatus Calescibacterium sp.]
MSDWYTLLCFGILILCAVRSALRGFSKEFLVFVGLVLGLLFGLRYYVGAVAFFRSRLGWESPWLGIVSFLFFFLPTVILFSFFGVRFRRIFERLDIIWVDALLGFFVGLLKGMLWILVITVFVANVAYLKFLEEGIARSRFYRDCTLPAIVYVDRFVSQFPQIAFLRPWLAKGASLGNEDFLGNTHEF